MNFKKSLRFLRCLTSATLLTVLAANAHAQDLNALLRAADKFRMTADNLQVDTLVTTKNADGSVDKERHYLVFAQANNKSLVLMKSAAEKWQKVLMLGDDFWLLMPDSQRPVRITPMQKLLGDASTGDISSMRWEGDYTAKMVGEESCESNQNYQNNSTQRTPCLHLSLISARKGVTYQRIELWLGKARSEPIKADFYVQSERIAKQATFIMDKPNAPTVVNEMVLRDQLSNHKTTHIRYQNRKPREVPSEWLNPMFLSRNPVLE